MVQLHVISPVNDDTIREFNQWLQARPEVRIIAMTLSPGGSGASQQGRAQSYLLVAYERSEA
jgi:hypothetical protein